MGAVRIIGGRWRGRKLKFPNVGALRPTHDRIRETLFNWLMQDISGTRCLDLFAGSGALGFEALSRGADEAVFVESDAAACRALNANVELLNAQTTAIHHMDAMSLANDGTFDIVFLDPPFHSTLYIEVAQWLETNHYLSEDALIYLEIEKGAAVTDLPSNWCCTRHKSTSSIDFYLFKRNHV